MTLSDITQPVNTILAVAKEIESALRIDHDFTHFNLEIGTRFASLRYSINAYDGLGDFVTGHGPNLEDAVKEFASKLTPRVNQAAVNRAKAAKLLEEADALMRGATMAEAVS